MHRSGELSEDPIKRAHLAAFAAKERRAHSLEGKPDFRETAVKLGCFVLNTGLAGQGMGKLQAADSALV